MNVAVDLTIYTQLINEAPGFENNFKQTSRFHLGSIDLALGVGSSSPGMPLFVQGLAPYLIKHTSLLFSSKPYLAFS